MTLYHDPVNTFVAEFLGSPRMNLLPIVWQRDGGGARLSVGANIIDWNGADSSPLETSRDDLLLGVRPEHFEIVPSNGGADGSATIAATLEVAERLEIPSCSTCASRESSRSSRSRSPRKGASGSAARVWPCGRGAAARCSLAARARGYARQVVYVIMRRLAWPSAGDGRRAR